MKKTVLVFSLSLAALGFLLSPAMVAASPDPAAPALSAEDQEFLASLAAPVVAPAPETAAKRPHIAAKAMCTADCGAGTSVSCPGNPSFCTATNRNCAAGVRGNVTCDGTKYKCPLACPDCDALQAQCAASCESCPIGTFRCDPYLCICGHNPNCV